MRSHTHHTRFLPKSHEKLIQTSWDHNQISPDTNLLRTQAISPMISFKSHEPLSKSSENLSKSWEFSYKSHEVSTQISWVLRPKLMRPQSKSCLIFQILPERCPNLVRFYPCLVSFLAKSHEIWVQILAELSPNLMWSYPDLGPNLLRSFAHLMWFLDKPHEISTKSHHILVQPLTPRAKTWWICGETPRPLEVTGTL